MPPIIPPGQREKQCSLANYRQLVIEIMVTPIPKHTLSAILATMSLATVSCGVVGPKIDFYDPSEAERQGTAARIVGSKSIGEKPLSPILVYLGQIDGKATGRAKAARCNFDSPYPVSPGAHDLLVAISAGELFATSRIGHATLQIEIPSNSLLTVRGEVHSSVSATLWVTDKTGAAIGDQIPVVLKDSPSKGMPIGFAMMEDSCAMP